DRSAVASAARHGEDADADGAPAADGTVETPQGLAAMMDWLGILAPARTPPPDLKGRVLARALAPRRRWPLAVAASFVLAAAGGGGGGDRPIPPFRARSDTLARPLAA